MIFRSIFTCHTSFLDSFIFEQLLTFIDRSADPDTSKCSSDCMQITAPLCPLKKYIIIQEHQINNATNQLLL